MLMDELHTSTWYRQLPFTKRPQVEYINPKEVVGIIDTTGDAKDHTFITAMGLLRVGLDTMLQANSTPTNSVREKLDRMLRV
jgi:cell division protein FtsA